jgi:LPS export ABC transporter protein LptC
LAQRTYKIKLTLGALVVVCITAIAWIFYQQRQGMSSVKIPLPASGAKALIALSNVHQTATKDGAVQWKLDAKSAELEADTGRMVLEAPEVEFHLDDGTTVHLTAHKGILFTRNNNIQVQGNVHVINDRYTLVTEMLSYEHAQRLLRTDKPVKITSQAFGLSSAKMTYDLNTNQAQLDGDVNGVIYERPAI